MAVAAVLPTKAVDNVVNATLDPKELVSTNLQFATVERLEDGITAYGPVPSPMCSSNRAELTAIVRAIEKTKEDVRCTMIS